MILTYSEIRKFLDIIYFDSDIQVYELPPGIYEIVEVVYVWADQRGWSRKPYVIR